MDESLTPPPDDQTESNDPIGSTPRLIQVLVVDNDRIGRSSLRRLIWGADADTGHPLRAVDEAETKDAVTAFGRLLPDVVSLKMGENPNQETEAVREILTRWPWTSIAVSALNLDPDILARLSDLGVRQIVTHPYRCAPILEAIRAAAVMEPGRPDRPKDIPEIQSVRYAFRLDATSIEDAREVIRQASADMSRLDREIIYENNPIALSAGMGSWASLVPPSGRADPPPTHWHHFWQVVDFSVLAENEAEANKIVAELWGTPEFRARVALDFDQWRDSGSYEEFPAF